MSTTTTSQAFPDGLVDSILSQLSLSLRNHLIFNWAHRCAQCADQHSSIAGIISTITTLDFSSYRSIDPNNFISLSNLPLSNLKHLNLSGIPFTDRHRSQILGTISSSPVFASLESLDLSNSKQEDLDDLFSGPNFFLNLTTLNLSGNHSIFIDSLFNTDKLPSLRHLDLSMCCLKGKNAVEIMAESTVGFKLESFNLSENSSSYWSDPFMALLKAPLMVNIKDLNLDGTGCDSAAVSFLLDDKAGPFSRKLIVDPPHHHQSQQQSQHDCSDHHTHVISGSNQLTRLSLAGTFFNQKSLCDLASSPLVSNLTHLSLGLDYRDSMDLGVLRKSKYLSNLKELSIHFRLNPTSLARLLSSSDDDTEYPSFRLEKLEVRYAIISHQDIMALCTSPCLSTLKSLSLCGCELLDNNDDNGDISQSSFDWDTALDLLSQSKVISNLAHLDLATLTSSPSLLSSLKSFLRSDLLSSDLIELDLSANELDAECIEIITSRRVIEGDETSPLKFGKLQILNLCQCGLKNVSLSSIFNLTELQHLDISYYHGDDGDALINSLTSTQDTLPFLPKLSNLTHLNLRDSKITNSGAIALSQSQLLNGLVELDLSYHHLSNGGLDALARTKLVSKLKVLDLCYNHARLQIKDLPYLGDCEVNQ